MEHGPGLAGCTIVDDCSSEDARACAEALDALHAYLDGELEPARLARIRVHLEACRRCGLEAESYRALKRAVGNTGNGVDAAALERLRTFARGLVVPNPRSDT